MTPGARTIRLAILAVAAMTTLAGCGSSTTANTKLAGNPEAGIHKIRHVIVIVQENRSFDSYFGTYPGADGIPMKNGVPTVCSYDYEIRQCVSPYYDPSVINTGGPHNVVNSRRDVAHGRMDGFVRQALDARTQSCGQHVLDPSCTIDVSRPDVMGYHDYHQIPNYWAYARNFVLDDHFFASNDGWSEPMHEAIVSAWSAKCTSPFDPMSCVSSADRTGAPHTPGQPWYPWTDLTWLLHRYDVSWAYYISAGMQPDCATGVMGCHSDPAERRNAVDLEPAAALHRRAAGPPGQPRPGLVVLLQGGEGGQAAGGVVGDPQLRRERAPAGLDHRADRTG